jgi:prephenate dehydrogenase
VSKPHFEKLVIAGVGLMGGSLGLAVKRARLARSVVGLARRPLTLRQAKQLGCIDQGTLDPAVAAAGADLVVLAGPVSSTPGLFTALAPHLPAGCLVTDVGSTKGWLLSQLQPSLARRKSLVFIGSHPMAGSEKAGVSESQAQLYDRALCLLVPAPGAPTAALKRLQAFWRGVGCGRVLTLSALAHDQLTAAASHLPHVAAVTLVSALADEAVRDPRVLDVAASGFMDTTRIAASLPGMWADILLTNRRELGARLGRMIERLRRFRGLLASGRRTAVLAELERARALRLRMERTHGKR